MFSARGGFNYVTLSAGGFPIYPAVATEAQLTTEMAKMGSAGNASSSNFTSDMSNTNGSFGVVSMPNDKIFITDYGDGKHWILDPTDDSMSSVASGAGTIDLTECTLGLDGNVWIGGRNTRDLYWYNFTSGSVGTVTNVFPSTYYVNSMETLPDGNIMCVPSGVSGTDLTIFSFNPSTGTATDMGQDISVTNAQVYATLALNGDVYLPPLSGANTHVLKYDYSADSWSSINVSGVGWAGGVTAPNGKLYFAPSAAETILVIDPSDDSTSTIGSFATGGTSKFRRGHLGADGRIYFAKYQNTVNEWCVVDPSVDSSTKDPGYLSALPSGFGRGQGYAANNNSDIIYAFNWDTLSQVVKIDTNANTAIDSNFWTSPQIND